MKKDPLVNDDLLNDAATMAMMVRPDLSNDIPNPFLVRVKTSTNDP